MESKNKLLDGKGGMNEEDEEYPEAPDNSRPPPEQKVRARERKERPDIFAHPLLKSMDTSWVTGEFNRSQEGQSKPSYGQKPRQ